VTLANAITLLRMGLSLLFGWLWASGHHRAALGAFAAAAVSDVLDGLAARALDQRTRLGALLDPAADKLMMLVAFVVGVRVGAVPWGLAAVVIGRDLVVTAGAGLLALVLRGHLDPARLRPTRIGKYSTMAEALTIGLALLTSSRSAPALEPWLAPLVLLTFALAGVSALQYAGRALLLLVEEGRRARAVPLPGAA
jgi:cardiolipin synthase